MTMTPVIVPHSSVTLVNNFQLYQPTSIFQQGIQAVKSRLRSDEGGRARIFFVRDSLVEVDEELKEKGLPTCAEEEFDGYVWDKGHNESVNSKKDELPVDNDNHGADSTRYMVAFIDSLADDPEEFEAVVFGVGDEDMVEISPF